MAVAYTESQFFTTTLSKVGGLNASQTTGIVLQSVTGIFDTTKPGVALLNYSDPLSTTVAEWATYTSINATTKTLVGVTRGAEGFSAKTHDNGVTIAFPHSRSHINNLAAGLAIGGDYTNIVTGVLDEDTLSSDSAVKLATQQSIKAYVDTSVGGITTYDTTGWVASTDTWVYASATSFTIAGADRTAIFTPGTRIKLTQTTAKYFVVTSSSFSTNTTVNITAGTSYTFANAAVTSPYYSYQVNPQGYPGWFTYTPSETWTNPPSSRTNFCKFSVNGRKCTMLWGTVGTANGSNSSSTIVLTVPIALASVTITRHPVLGHNLWTDNATFTDLGQVYSTATSSITADFPSTTRKPTIVDISASWEI